MILEKIKDKNLHEIIEMLLNNEISLNDFNRDFCEEYPSLYINIIYNFQTWELFEMYIKLNTIN